MRSPHDLPISARVADGAFRGCCIGALWVVWFGSTEARGVPSSSRFLHMTRFTLLTPLGFATFFAAYNAVLVGAERTVGQGTMSPVLAGGTAGAFMGALVTPFRAANVLGCAASTALVCAAFQKALQ